MLLSFQAFLSLVVLLQVLTRAEAEVALVNNVYEGLVVALDPKLPASTEADQQTIIDSVQVGWKR